MCYEYLKQKHIKRMHRQPSSLALFRLPEQYKIDETYLFPQGASRTKGQFGAGSPESANTGPLSVPGPLFPPANDCRRLQGDITLSRPSAADRPAKNNRQAPRARAFKSHGLGTALCRGLSHLTATREYSTATLLQGDSMVCQFERQPCNPPGQAVPGQRDNFLRDHQVLLSFSI